MIKFVRLFGISTATVTFATILGYSSNPSQNSYPVSFQAYKRVEIGTTLVQVQKTFPTPVKECSLSTGERILGWTKASGGYVFMRFLDGEVQAKWLADQLFQSVEAQCQ